MIETTEEKYMYQLVIPSKVYYDRLVTLKNQYPELTYQNKGYEGLPKEVIEKYKSQIEEIFIILKNSLKGFSSFQNFKDRPDGSWVIRLHYKWAVSFIGVGYFDSRHWDPKEHGKH